METNTSPTKMQKEESCCCNGMQRQRTTHSDLPPLQPRAVSGCGCSGGDGAGSVADEKVASSSLGTVSYLRRCAVALALWGVVYAGIEPCTTWLVEKALGLTTGMPLAEAVRFFVYDSVKIFLLLVLLVYVVAWLRATLNTERVRGYLTGKRRVLGYSLGAGFGAVTPFCSCSSIPLFLSFTTAGLPLGVTMAFLITSPLINEVAVIVLWGVLGWKIALLYVSMGLLIGIIGGFFMDAIGAQRWLQPYILESLRQPPRLFLQARNTPQATVWQRHIFAREETRKIVRNVWMWILIGVGIGAVLHGYVPQQWCVAYLGAGQWWSVPAAVAIGIPLYTNVTGIVPVMESLLLKGVPLGTTMAFCMSTVGASLPELMMLKQVLRLPLLAVFTGFLLVSFTLVGWLFNAIPWAGLG